MLIRYELRAKFLSGKMASHTKRKDVLKSISFLQIFFLLSLVQGKLVYGLLEISENPKKRSVSNRIDFGGSVPDA